MWNLSVKPRTVRVTHALAKKFSEMEPAPRDRPLSERRLLVYERLLNKGQFRPVTWALAVCKATGGTYRVNGKHTSTLLAGMKAIPEFFVTIEEYGCQTLEDVAELYATFDSKMMSRTTRDINLSFAGTIKELDGVPARTISKAVAGMAWQHWAGQLKETTATERAELLMEHTPFVLWLDQILNQDERQHGQSSARRLDRQPVVAALFATWLRDQNAAGEFWRMVRDETGSSPDLPDRVIARWLLTTNSNRGGGARWNNARHADTREIYCKCLYSWNSWRSGENRCRLQYQPTWDLPEVK